MTEHTMTESSEWCPMAASEALIGNHSKKGDLVTVLSEVAGSTIREPVN